jgi:hypothetical protein
MYSRDARTGVRDYVNLAWSIVNDTLDAKAIARRLKEIGAEYPIDGAIEELRNRKNCYENWGEQLRYFMFPPTIDEIDFKVSLGSRATLAVGDREPVVYVLCAE